MDFVISVERDELNVLLKCTYTVYNFDLNAHSLVKNK